MSRHQALAGARLFRPLSGVAVSLTLAVKHTVTRGAPVLPSSLLLAQAVEVVLDSGFIHIGSEHQAAIAKGAGFMKNLLKHDYKPPVSWKASAFRPVVVKLSPVLCSPEIGISIIFPPPFGKNQTGQSFLRLSPQIILLAQRII